MLKSPIIEALWGVPLIVWEEEIINLTWSSYIVMIGWKRILVDLWMFQWSEAADYLNTENVWYLKDIDAVVITHAHIDHIGRLPLLYQHGFRWQIYMTSATRDIWKEMLLDSFKIQQNDWEGKDRIAKKLIERFTKAVAIKTELEELNWNLSKEDRWKIKTSLTKKIWGDYDSKMTLEEVEEYLSFYSIESKEDIEIAVSKLWELPFTEQDVYETLEMVQPIEYWIETVLSSKKKNVKNNNHENQNILDTLPYFLANWMSSYDFTLNSSERRLLKWKWEEKLEADIKKSIKSHSETIKENHERVKKELEAAYIYVYEQYAFLDNATDEQKKELSNVVAQRRLHRNYLKRYKIKNKEDIESAIEDKSIVERFRIGIDYNSNDIQKALKCISTGKNASWNDRELITFTFRDAAHVVWSIWVTFTEYENATSTKKLKYKTESDIFRLLDIKWESISVSLWWDLWRIEWNRLWSPQLPEKKVSYLQVESTYGWREHRPRKDSVAELVSLIEESKWDVLMSVFSQQRMQEMMLTIAEECMDGTLNIDDYEIIIDWPLWEKVTSLYFKHRGDVYNLLKESEQIRVFGRVIFRFLKEWEHEELYKNNDENLVIKKINKEEITRLMYAKRKNDLLNLKEIVGSEKYNEILDDIIKWVLSEVDKEKSEKDWFDYSNLNKVFAKILKNNQTWEQKSKNSIDKLKQIVGNYLNEDEQSRLTFTEYSKKRRKRIILTSSGMMNGGAIMNHLPYILKNPHCSLLAPWYLSEWTLWHAIVTEWKESVVIKWEKVQIACNRKFIDGFSSHISHSEILDYLTRCLKEDKIEKNGTIAFVHGSYIWQGLLKYDLEKILELHNRTDVKVHIPELFSSYDVVSKKSIKLAPENIPKVNVEEWKKTTPNKTPKYLLKTPKKKEVSSEELKRITRLRELREEIEKECIVWNDKSHISHVVDLLKTWLEKNLDFQFNTAYKKNISPILRNLTQISPEQEKILVELVKRQRNIKESNFVMNFQKNKPGYRDERTHDIVFWSGDFEQTQLEKLLEEDNFNWDTKLFLEEKLNLLKSENDEKKKRNIITSIDKRIRLEGRKMRSPWIDLNFSVNDLENDILTFLETIFQKEYFEDYIAKNFDVNSFLLSKKSLKDYIIKKYELEKLTWSEKLSKHYNDIIEYIEDMQWILDKILEERDSSLQNEEDLCDILYWAQLTVEEIRSRIINI